MKYVKHLELFQILLKKDKPQTGRLLGMDVGERFVGLAVSDASNEIASPHSVLIRTRSDVNSIADNLQELHLVTTLTVGARQFDVYSDVASKFRWIKVDQFSLVGFVIGYPFPMYRFQSTQAFQVKQFVDQLKKISRFEGLVYTYWDERFTTKAVESMLKPLDLHPSHMKRILDKFAAVGILQGCLDDFQRQVKCCVEPDS
ncbi:uncharacterized protein LOC131067372 isoform X1 [Cryptomeria japonica]|uniref:uncharacterized protein LOC131067372 isoform X1 n=1 Tax=Cryptomeria japonica TaxID=3369 RepID=UPI0025ACE5FB|nr:uncharacterized protein LOC131067372 isoform X1 [Cryptomeria japonica]XP_057858323.1 uncharacterized protein LOC131067372 isoform X1 [Cryptomeria japonica]XP_057858324.1 uncharacterized protein LOC131067372 isoform X1 [Cryptomeria japonica]XP_059063350.1 uncharacterized protein LOC131067372 isoform X1 [Cryptomeria japonica]